MLDIFYSAKFKKDAKLMKKQGRDMGLLRNIVNILAAEKPLDPIYKDHPLSGKYIGQRECHIQSDWLLVYKVEKKELRLTLTRTGSHSVLFDE